MAYGIDLCLSNVNPIAHFNFVTTMLFVVYNYNFITKLVLILPVFYYYVTLNFFLRSTYFWLTLYNWCFHVILLWRY